MEKHLFISIQPSSLDQKARIIEVTIINENGDVLLDTFINPSTSISKEATIVHQISTLDVQNAPYFWQIEDMLQKLFQNAFVYAYGMQNFLEMLKNSVSSGKLDMENTVYLDLQEPFSQLYGEPHPICGYTLKNQEAACKYYGLACSKSNRTYEKAKEILALYHAMLNDDVELNHVVKF